VKKVPDGGSIQAGLIVIFMRAFPQVIEDGRLYIVQPPLFGFNDGGKRVFVASNREYITYLQNKFSKHNDIYFKKEKMSKTQVREFLLRNEQYLDYLQKVADNSICTPEFIELICANLQRLGYDKKSVAKWDALVKKEFSPQLNAVWNDGCVEISGIKDSNWEMIELDDDFVNDKKTKKLITLMNANIGNIYGYSVEGSDGEKNLSIAGVLNIFGKYKVKDLTRYKGLGEMNPQDLRATCMDGTHQRLVQITVKDTEKAFEDMAMWHSSKQAARDSRREFMSKYIPDLKELST